MNNVFDINIRDRLSLISLGRMQMIAMAIKNILSAFKWFLERDVPKLCRFLGLSFSREIELHKKAVLIQ